MPNNIDERIVEMQFDNKQFESGVKDTIKSLGDLKKSLKMDEVSTGFDDLSKSVSKVNLNPLQNGVEVISQRFSALEVIAISALSRITNQAMATGERLIKSFTVAPITAGWDKYESKVAAVQKIVNASADNTIDKVEKVLDEIEWFTNETSYDFNSMVSALGSFSSAGIELEKSKATIIGLANAAAISGVNARDFSHASIGFQRAISSGYLSLGIWNSYLKTAGMQSQVFIQACIDSAVKLGTLKKGLDGVAKTAKGTQVTVSSFAETLNEKWVSSEVIADLSDRFSVASTKLYELSDDYSTVNDAIKANIGTLDAYSLKAFQAGQETKTWGDAIEYVRGTVAQGWSKTWELIFGNYEEATKFFSDLTNNAFYDLFVSMGDFRNEMLEVWRDSGGAASFRNSLLNIATTFDGIVNHIRAGVIKLFPILGNKELMAAGLTRATEIFEEVTGRISDVFALANPFFEEVEDAIEEVTGKVEDAINTTEEGKQVFEDVATMVSKIIRGDFGNGAARKTALEELGWSYEGLQNKVNEALNCSFRYRDELGNVIEVSQKVTEANGEVSETMEEEAEKIDTVSMTAKNLASTFKGAVAIVQIVASAISAVIRVGARLIPYMTKFGEGTLGITGSIGDMLVSLRDFVVENDIFYKGLSKVADFLGTQLQPVIEWFNEKMESLKNRTSDFSGVIENIQTKLEELTDIKFFEETPQWFTDISEKARTFYETVKSDISNVYTMAKDSGILSKAIAGIGIATGTVVTTFKNLGNTIKTTGNNAFQEGSNMFQIAQEWYEKYSGKIPSIGTAFKNFWIGLIPTGVLGRNAQGMANKIFSSVIPETGFVARVRTASTAFRKYKDLLDDLFNELKKGSPVFASFTQGIDNVKIGFQALWIAVKELSKAGFERVKIFFEPFIETIRGFFDKIMALPFERIGRIVALAGYILLMYKTLSVLEGGAKFLKSIGNIGTSISGFFKALKMKAYTSIALSVAAAIGIIAGVFYLLSRMDWPEIWKGAIAIGVIGTALALSLAALAGIAHADPKSAALGVASAFVVVLAIGGLVAAIYYINKFSTDELRKGLERIAGIFLALVIILEILKWRFKSGNTVDLKSMLALYVFVAALGRVMELLTQLRDFDDDGLLRSIVALAAISFVLVRLAKGLNGLKFSNTIGFIGMVGALWLFVQVLKGIANQDFNRLLSGLIKLVPVLIGMLGMGAAAKLAGNGGMGMAAMLISFAISLKMIAEVIQDLGKMDPGRLARGGYAVAAIAVVMAIIVREFSRQASTMHFFGSGAGADVAKEFLALAASVWIIAQAMKSISDMPLDKMFLSAVSLGLVIVALGAAVGLAADPFKGGAAKILAFALVIGVITGALMLLQFMDMPSILKSAGALGGVILAVGFALKGFTDVKIGSTIAQALAIAGVIYVTVWALSELKNLGDANLLLKNAESLALIVAAVGVVITIMAKLNIGIVAAATAGAGLSVAIAEIVGMMLGLAEIVVALGNGSEVIKALDVIVAVFEKLGEAFGKMIGGAIFGFTERLPEAGDNMSKFASNLKDFVKVFSDTKWVTVASSIKDFSSAMSALNKVSMDPTKYANFANIMSEFAAGIDTFFHIINSGGVDVNKTKTAAEALDVLTDILKKDVGNFDATKWMLFNSGINYAAATVVTFYDKIKTDNAFDLGRIQSFSKVIDELVLMTEKIDEIGSFDGFSKLTGAVDENGMDDLTRLAQSIINFNKTIGMTGNEEDALNVDRITKVIGAVKQLAIAASKVPSGGGELGSLEFDSFFIGSFKYGGSEFKGFSWDTLSNGLTGLASALVDFATTSNGIDDAGLEKGLGAIDQFVTKSQTLPKSIAGELEKFIFGDSTINGFATGITGLGTSLQTFTTSLKDLKPEDLSSPMAMIDKILEIPAAFKESGFVSEDGHLGISLSAIGYNLVTFAEKFKEAVAIFQEVASAQMGEDGSFDIGTQLANLFNSFLGAFNEDIVTRLNEAGQLMANSVADGLALDTGYVQERTQVFMGYIMDTLQLQSNLDLFKTRGHDLSGTVSKAFNDGESLKVAKSAANDLAIKMSDELKSVINVARFKASGEALADGLIAGFLSKKRAAIDAANEMAAAMNAAFEGKEEINSPSHVWQRYGAGMPEGLSMGMIDNVGMVVDAAKFLADRLNGEFQEDSRLSVTPVVDITGASNSANKLSNMFDSSRAAALSANMQINSQVSQIDSLVDVTNRILGSIQNGSDLYLDDNILAGRINRRLGVL